MFAITNLTTGELVTDLLSEYSLAEGELEAAVTNHAKTGQDGWYSIAATDNQAKVRRYRIQDNKIIYLV